MKNISTKIVGYALWCLIALLAMSLVKNIGRANQVARDIAAEKQKVVKMEADNTKLQAELLQTQSVDFIEKQIRDKLGLGKTGEAMVVLPDDDTLRKLAPVIPEDIPTLPDPTWKKWLHIFI